MLRHGRCGGLLPSVRRPDVRILVLFRDLRQRAWEAGGLLPRPVWLAVGEGAGNRLLADSDGTEQYKLFQRRIDLPPHPRGAQLGALRERRVARCGHRTGAKFGRRSVASEDGGAENRLVCSRPRPRGKHIRNLAARFDCFSTARTGLRGEAMDQKLEPAVRKGSLKTRTTKSNT